MQGRLSEDQSRWIVRKASSLLDYFPSRPGKLGRFSRSVFARAACTASTAASTPRRARAPSSPSSPTGTPHEQDGRLGLGASLSPSLSKIGDSGSAVSARAGWKTRTRHAQQEWRLGLGMRSGKGDSDSARAGKETRNWRKYGVSSAEDRHA